MFFGHRNFTVSNIKVDIFSYNNKRRNLCRGGGGVQRNRVLSRLSQIQPQAYWPIIDTTVCDRRYVNVVFTNMEIWIQINPQRQ